MDSIQATRDRSGLAALRHEWRELLDRSRAGVFNSWEWLYPWADVMAPSAELLVLSARDSGGMLIGLLPLWVEVVRAGGRRLRRLAFIGDTEVIGCDHRDVVARTGRERETATAFAQVLQDTPGEWDVIDLLDIDSTSPALAALRDAFPASAYDVRVRPRYRCPYQRLAPGESFDVFLRRTSRRNNYRRRLQWLQRQPGFCIEIAAEPESVSRPLEEFFRLHALRWSEDGGSQGIPSSRVEAFHRDATRYLAERGWLRLFTLRLGSKALGSAYGICHAGRFSYFQSGYDPAWASRSVGLVLIGETFRHAIESGVAEYDFLRGTESYKSDWTDEERQTVSLRVHPRGGAGAWLSRQEDAAAWARGVAKRMLPPIAIDRVRRILRGRNPFGVVFGGRTLRGR